MELKQLEERVMEVIKNLSYVNEDGGIEIYTDYRDRELSDNFIAEIMKSKNPRERFKDELCEWAMDYALEYGEDELEKDIRRELTEEEEECFIENFDYIWDVIREQTYFYYDENDFNGNEVRLNILVDCGNWNYDCVKDNILNWYGANGYGDSGNIDKLSSILWLAKTQKKATKLRKACKHYFRNDSYYVDREKDNDKFIESCIQELENLSSHMSTITFLISVSLSELFDLMEKVNEVNTEEYKYSPQNNPNKSYMVLDKKTECGLFDPWHGGGSCLEIKLDNDVKLPLAYARITIDGCKTYGYDVDEVYGLVGSCWKDTIKEIVTQ